MKKSILNYFKFSALLCLAVVAFFTIGVLQESASEQPEVKEPSEIGGNNAAPRNPLKGTPSTTFEIGGGGTAPRPIGAVLSSDSVNQSRFLPIGGPQTGPKPHLVFNMDGYPGQEYSKFPVSYPELGSLEGEVELNSDLGQPMHGGKGWVVEPHSCYFKLKES